jgi:hypothetical protein
MSRRAAVATISSTRWSKAVDVSTEAPRYAIYETKSMLDALEHDGYATIAHALSPQQCAQARAMIDAMQPVHWDEVAAGATDEPGRRIDRYLCVFNRDPYWLQFIDRPGVIELAEAALGADCHIIGMTAWRSHPGHRSEALHVDYLPFASSDSALPALSHIAIFIMTVHFYLTDVTADLAPTRIVPSSHRAGRAPRDFENDWQGRAPEIILARAGDALVFRSDVWHAGSDNRSQRDIRYLLQVHYGRREMAQHFSPFMEWRFNPAVLAAASKRQRRLLGDHDPAAYD